MEIKHLGTETIITDRLKLRKFKNGDEVAMYKNYVTDPNVTEYVTWNPHKDIEETRGFVNRWVDSYNEMVYRWAICLKDTDEVIGSIDIVRAMFGYTTVETGYVLSREYWNKGIMTEALKAVIEYMKRVGVHRIQAKHVVENIGSGRVMEKAGMTKEGVMRESAYKNGEFQDLAIWAIIV